MRTLFRTLIICSAVLTISTAAVAGIYKYRDENGRLSFVDDESKIPARFRHEVTPVAEAENTPMVFDPPNEQDDTIPAPFLGQEKTLNAAEEKRRLEHQTPVIISNNRVLVPVEVAMGNRVVKLSLLLDTGASATVFHRDALADLDLPSGKKFNARVAGGGTVPSERINFRYVSIGPFQINKTYAMVINSNGQSLPFDGMLGMDFLKNHPYQIDFQNEVILWDFID